MPATVIAGISGPIWGCTDNDGWLFTHNHAITPQREKDELKNGQSEFVQALWFSPKRTMTMSGRVRVLSATPDKDIIGHIVTITDGDFAGTWFLDEITQSKELDGWMSFEGVFSEYEDPSTGSFTTTTT